MEQFIKIQIENRQYLFKWVEGNPDYIEDENGFFLHYPAEKPKDFYNFDEVKISLNNKEIHCNITLDIINLMNDFGFNTKELISDKIYQKLFWGCNLPSVTPDDKEYEPIWEESEVQEIINCISKLVEIKNRIKNKV